MASRRDREVEEMLKVVAEAMRNPSVKPLLEIARPDTSELTGTLMLREYLERSRHFSDLIDYELQHGYRTASWDLLLQQGTYETLSHALPEERDALWLALLDLATLVVAWMVALEPDGTAAAAAVAAAEAA